jgi:hypothetical protein
MAAAAVGLVLALSGCGVSASSQPRKLGDAYAPASLPNFAQAPSEPTAADPAELVRQYLDAAAGGNQAAVDQTRLFLTANGKKNWHAPEKDALSSILIIHIDAVVTQAQVDNGTPVDLTYHEVGTLNANADDGRITPSNNTQSQRRRLQVVRATDQVGQLRIDSGALPDLVLSDDALVGNTYYRQQPIYFWDASNQVLVPDLRYVPMTVPPERRAYEIISYFQSGPSQLLGEAVNKFPNNNSLPSVYRGSDSSLVIKLSTSAGGKGPDDARRLVYQLQASVIPVTGIVDLEIWIGNNQAPSTGASDYRQYELSSGLPIPMEKYDIVDGVVKPTTSDTVGTAPNLPLLAAKENSAVEYAAISRADAQGDSTGAFVRVTSPGADPTLVLVPNSGKTITVGGLPHSGPASRPAWIPGIGGLLVAWGGGLYLVDLSGNATRVSTPGLGAITEVTVSPDGRRVAMMAGGQVTISALEATNPQSGPSVHLDGQQVIAPDPDLSPSAVAWDSEVAVDIVGHGANATPALWLVTIDGALAIDKSNTLKGVDPIDVVSYPRSDHSEAVVLQGNGGGPYRVNSSVVSQDGTKSPFYVD